MRRLKVVTLAAGIGQTFLVILISRMRFRDDFPVHGKLLPFPPMVVVHVKTPNEIHGSIDLAKSCYAPRRVRSNIRHRN